MFEISDVASFKLLTSVRIICNIVCVREVKFIKNYVVKINFYLKVVPNFELCRAKR